MPNSHPATWPPKNTTTTFMVLVNKLRELEAKENYSKDALLGVIDLWTAGLFQVRAVIEAYGKLTYGRERFTKGVFEPFARDR